MSPLQVAVFGGMISAAGLVLAVAAVRPAAPRLSLVLAALNAAAPADAEATSAGQSISERAPWWSRWLPAAALS